MGHKESQCYKKNPKKAPIWWEEKIAKTESSSSRAKVMLTSLDGPGKTGFHVKALQAKMGDTLTILHQENVWICDTSVSMPIMQSSKCAKNMNKTQTLSLRHTREAMGLQL